MDIRAAIDRCAELTKPAEDWYQQIYDEKFKKYFDKQKELMKRIKSSSNPITDEELEYILVDVPIHLFEVSEELNRFKLSLEIIKLNHKEKSKQLSEGTQDELVELKEEVLQYQIVSTVYSNVIDRVGSEKAYSRELIMSAKKIWEARRSTDNSNPVSEIDTDNVGLPDYDAIAKNQYIK